MKLGAWDEADIRRAMLGDGVFLHFGPFVTRLRGDVPQLAGHLRSLYAHHEIAHEAFAESTITIQVTRERWRPWVRQAHLRIDERRFMHPLAPEMAVPMLEWGMNWIVATRAHQFLLCHSAVLEKNGRAVVMPADSGAGKSTLTALLMSAGWRLFSDEFAIIRISDLSLLPMPRALSLKNRSIELAKSLHPHAAFTRKFDHTIKGTLAFMGAPQEAVERSQEPAALGMLLFPRYDSAVSLEVEELGRAAAFSDFVGHSMNYAALGERGFRGVSAIVEHAPALRLTYGDVDRAIAWFEERAGEFA